MEDNQGLGCTLAGLDVRFLLAGLASGSAWLRAAWPPSPLQACTVTGERSQSHTFQLQQLQCKVQDLGFSLSFYCRCPSIFFGCMSQYVEHGLLISFGVNKVLLLNAEMIFHTSKTEHVQLPWKDSNCLPEGKSDHIIASALMDQSNSSM